MLISSALLNFQLLFCWRGKFVPVFWLGMRFDYFLFWEWERLFSRRKKYKTIWNGKFLPVISFKNRKKKRHKNLNSDRLTVEKSLFYNRSQIFWNPRNTGLNILIFLIYICKVNDIFIMTDSISDFANLVYINLYVLYVSLTFWTVLKNFLYKKTLELALCITFRKKCCPESQCQFRNNSIVSYLFILFRKPVLYFCNLILAVFI